MDQSIDDQLIREAREDRESRERLRIKGLLREEYLYWRAVDDIEPGAFLTASGAMGALANVLCRIDGLLPPREDTDE